MGNCTYTVADRLNLAACMMCVSIASRWVHHLTRYAVCLFYLMVILIAGFNRQYAVLKHGSWQKAALAAMVGAVIFSNVQIANTAYIKKDLEREATLSTMTRVLARLEEYEDYRYDESEVAIVGEVNKYSQPLSVGAVEYITGLTANSQITDKMKTYYFFELVLQYPIHLCSDKKELEIVDTEEFQKMGVFPAKDCISTIDGVIVVKLAESPLFF